MAQPGKLRLETLKGPASCSRAGNKLPWRNTAKSLRWCSHTSIPSPAIRSCHFEGYFDRTRWLLQEPQEDLTTGCQVNPGVIKTGAAVFWGAARVARTPSSAGVWRTPRPPVLERGVRATVADEDSARRRGLSRGCPTFNRTRQSPSRTAYSIRAPGVAGAHLDSPDLDVGLLRGSGLTRLTFAELLFLFPGLLFEIPLPLFKLIIRLWHWMIRLGRSDPHG